MKRIFLTLLVALAAPAWPAIIFNVNMNTSSLAGAGTFQIDFQFIDGSGAPGDLNNNTVTISNFSFGAGAASGSPSLFNGASGDLSAAVTMKDSAFFNEFTQNFTAGNTLSFQIQLTTNPDPGGTPDEFSFALLDSGGSELPTTGPASEFLDITIDSSSPVPLKYGSSRGAQFTIPAPSVAPVSSVPEPGTIAGVSAVAVMLLAGKLRRRP